MPLVRKAGLEMLHYESYSGAEFVRKWTNMVTSGPSIHFGPHRMRIAAERPRVTGSGGGIV